VSAAAGAEHDCEEFAAWADLLARGGDGLGLAVGDALVRRLWDYAMSLQHWSRRANLVGPAALRVIARVHVLDSMAAVRFLGEGLRSCADVGTGAGLPGMVGALMDAAVRWTLIDSAQRRCAFLDHVRSSLGVANVTVRCARAEEAGRDPELREAHDATIARAVGRLALVAEYCLPLTRVGGRCVAMKGPAVDRQVAAASPAIEALGGRVREVVRYRLPLGDEERRVVIIDKVGVTPDRYPRRAGVAAKEARRIDRGRRQI
jgi:16S rRNA (guanine527-N7)-methyltransferase